MRPANLGYGAFLLAARWRCRALGIYPVLAMQLLCFAMFACAFNLLLGFAGMLSFGHAAYFGFASYVTGWLITARHWDTLASIAAAVVVAALMGLVIGAIAIRRQGIYFAMITLALAPAGLLRLPAGAVHRRRERHPGRPPRHPARPGVAAARRRTCTTSCSRSSSPCSC